MKRKSYYTVTEAMTDLKNLVFIDFSILTESLFKFSREAKVSEYE